MVTSMTIRTLRVIAAVNATTAHGASVDKIQGFAAITKLQYLARGVPGSGRPTGGGG